MTACPEPWVVVVVVMILCGISAVLFVQADRCYRQTRRLCNNTLADMEIRHARLLKTLREVMP